MGVIFFLKKSKLEFISNSEIKGASRGSLILGFFYMYLIAKVAVTVLYDFLDNM